MSAPTLEDARAMAARDPERYGPLARTLEARREKLRTDARAMFRAMRDWPIARPSTAFAADPDGAQEENEASWAERCLLAREAYDGGRFLLERLGAERFLDPDLLITIWGLRQKILEEEGLTSHAQMMHLDLAVVAYYNALRIQGWIGNLALHIEHEWFGSAPPTAAFKQKYGQVTGLKVEDAARRFAEELLPLFDRANRTMTRNLKAMRELRPGAEAPPGPAPTVSIHTAGQVNVGEQQLNVTSPARPPVPEA